MFILFAAVLFISSHSALSFDEFSSYRDLNVDSSVYEKKVTDALAAEKTLRRSPIGSARRYAAGEKIPNSVAWKSIPDMQERFEKFRDERFMKDPSDANNLRRISWLYPIDGCWTRAALFNRLAFRAFIPIPSKVFAFGNLRVKTPNSRRGVVGWWYHVAPMVRVGNDQFVMDPSIEPTRPLTLNEWLGRMGKPERIRIAVCGSGTYSPGDNCDKESDGVEARAEYAVRQYLVLEKRELTALGRNTSEELGDNPPW